jgi:hypothetical protein
MLRIQGTFMGKTYEEPTIVSMESIAKAFGVELPSDKAPKMLRMAGIVERDLAGERRVAASRGIPRVMELQDPESGEYFTLHYAQRGVTGIEAVNVRLINEVTPFTTKTAERYLYMVLSPLCSNGVNANINKRSRYEIYDPEAQARQEALRFNALETVSKEIYSAPFYALRVKAAGISVKGQRADGSLDAEYQTRARLHHLASSDIEAFMNSWKSESTWGEGLLRIAIKDNFLDQIKMRGIFGWHWNKGPRFQSLICQINPAYDAFQQLRDASEADKEVFAIITKLIEPKDKVIPVEKKEEEKLVKQLGHDELISEAIEKGILSYNGTKMHVKFLKGRGPGKILIDNKTDEEWMDSLKAKVMSDRSLRDEIVTALTSK